MATLDDNVKSLIRKSYPQAKDGDSDPVKLSAAIFSNVEVSYVTDTIRRGRHANTFLSTRRPRRRRSSNG